MLRGYWRDDEKIRFYQESVEDAEVEDYSEIEESVIEYFSSIVRRLS